MAIPWKRIGNGVFLPLNKFNNLSTTFRSFSNKSAFEPISKINVSRTFLASSVAALATAYVVYRKYNSNHGTLFLFSPSEPVKAKSELRALDPPLTDPLLASSEKHHPTMREQRFHRFGSVEYQGHVFMTPQDFLESITYDNPRYRTGRLKMNKASVDKVLKVTPSIKKGSSHMFRKVAEQGLISYTEYLFLLCVLTKPKSGFKIAFNMFDLDGDERVDKIEFLVLEQLLAHTEKTGVQSSSDNRENLWTKLQLRIENILAGNFIEPCTDTTIMVHFFGLKGKDVMTYEDFSRFMEDLQTEVLELEFAEFSNGLKTITEIEFAQILLRYTRLTSEENDKYLNRLRSRITHPKGITFNEFKNFCQFLNSIDDFSLAMRIFSYADHPISQADFTRAVKSCSGQSLSTHLINVVFQLFDVDGDAKLSHKEFISVMRERMHRGAKNQSTTRWDNYKMCIKNQLKSSNR